MQQITRGDYLKDLITIYVDNNLQTSLTDLYSQFVFQCGEIQKVLTPAQVIKISFDEIESQLLKSTNTCYLAGITVEGHKETFNGSLTFNTRGEVVNYEPAASGSVTVSGTTANDCGCQGLRGVYSNCCQPAIKAYFSLNYVPTKLSELQNDTDFVDSVDVAESISIHNASTEAHPYIQSVITTETSLRVAATETLQGSINAETTAREQAVSLAISTTEAYADNSVSVHNSSTSAHTYIQSLISSESTAREQADNNLQTQIDGLAAASDVTDIVGTYAELQAYDTSKLNDNDIIKVLSDSTHQNQPSYYRFDKETNTFSYIGSEDAGYTKAQADAKFVTQTTTINGKALSSDINLTASDVGALSDTTTINDLTNTAQQNALNSGVTSSVVSQVSTNTSAIATNTSAIASNTSVIAQHTTAIASNTSDISTINGKIPTDASTSNKLVSASTLAASIADFANQDLSNLTNNGEARLHALKSYADEGELLTDPDGLAFVEKYAHSTFDRSKFTVVGSPTITEDGIARLSLNNYLKCGVYDWSKPFEIVTEITSLTGDNNWIYSFDGLTAEGLYNAFRILKSGDTCELIWDMVGIYNLIDVSNVPLSSLRFVKLSYNGTAYSISYKANRNDSWITKSVTSSKVIPHTQQLIIGAAIYRTFNGSIDLKQFSITVDGVEVFSGNKTGKDTIKPDNYTVVGSPTISADGIASGFTDSNYLKLPEIIDWSKPFVIECFTTTIYSSNYNQILLSFDNNDVDGLTNSLILTWNSGHTAFDLAWNIGGIYNLVNISNLQYSQIYFELIYDGTNSYTIRYKENKNDAWNIKTSTSSNTIAHTELLIIGDGLYRPWEGSIDLNAFKIYVDGNLVYQPCLKIPYTESKTGSKIVNSIYRPRVNDMAEQFGYANYYTLSDTDFTLPQVELYGLIGQRTLRDSYRNGINYWELYSNRDLEQGGSCTSGVEVTFPKPFADTNYVLSVPYSAKSVTAFTPTQTGDWIAKGRGVL